MSRLAIRVITVAALPLPRLQIFNRDRRLPAMAGRKAQEVIDLTADSPEPEDEPGIVLPALQPRVTVPSQQLPDAADQVPNVLGGSRPTRQKPAGRPSCSLRAAYHGLPHQERLLPTPPLRRRPRGLMDADIDEERARTDIMAFARQVNGQSASQDILQNRQGNPNLMAQLHAERLARRGPPAVSPAGPSTTAAPPRAAWVAP